MQKLVLIAASCLAIAMASPLDIVQDSEGQQFYLVPVSREKRQTDWKVEDPGRLKIKHHETFIDNDSHKLEGTAYLSKNFADRTEPLTTGGRVDYNHLNSGSGVSVFAENREREGTKVGAEGKLNVYRNGPFHVDVTGDYTRRYGGAGGTGRPSYNTWVHGTYDF